MSRRIPHSVWISAAALLLAGSALSAVRAQDAGPLSLEQTESLAHALGIYDAAASERALGGDRIMPEGDHYVVRLPIDMGREGAMVSGGDTTLHAKPLEDGRWSFDSITLPASLLIGDKDHDPLKVDFASTDLVYTAVVDPEHATTSTADLTLAAMKAHITGSLPEKDKPATPLDIAVEGGKTEDHAVTTAAVDGRVDQTTTFTLADLSLNVAGDKPLKMGMSKLFGTMKVGGMAPERARALQAKLDEIQKMMKATPAAAATPAPVTPTPDSNAPAIATSPAKAPMTAEQKAALKEFVAILREAFRSVDLTGEIDDVTVSDQTNKGVTMSKLVISTVAAAPESKLDAKETIAMEGLTVADLPPGLYARLVPRRVVFTPHVSGLPLDDVADMLNQMIDTPDADPSVLGPKVDAMLAKGPIRVAIDDLAFDVGPAGLTANGGVDVTSAVLPANAAKADIKVTHLDDLTKLLSSDPQLRQGVPFIIFLKGIGKQDGDVVTWHVESTNGQLTVNGQDMSQLMPH